jgi:hypothetical protein
MDTAARRRMKAALIVNALIIGLECAGLWQAFFHAKFNDSVGRVQHLEQ